MLAIALVAGAPVVTAVRLAVAMTLLQFTIGTVNDLVDAPRDGGRTPLKAIPAGLVSVRTARFVAVAAASGGLALAAGSGVPTLVVALTGLSCGLAYDAFLSRTAVSWLPLAIALPLVPVFAWLGVRPDLPPALLAVTPIAALAGVGLAVGNALIDVEADARLARRTVAVALGRPLAWLLHAASLAVAVLLVMVLVPAGGGAASVGAIWMGAAALGSGVVASGLTATSWRRIGWPLEAAGVVLMGIGWTLAAANGLS